MLRVVACLLLQLWSGGHGYSLDDVTLHSSASDCWVLFHGGIYSFPGGGTSHPKRSIYNYGVCGRDGTALFDTHHRVSELTTSLSRVGGTYIGVAAVATTPAPATTLKATTTTVAALAATTPAPAPGPAAVALSELQQHDSATDCWAAIHGNVYSFANGGSMHPGKSLFNHGICGRDATAAFDGEHTLSYLTVELARVGGALLAPLEAVTALAPTPAPSPTLHACRADEPVPPVTAITAAEVQAHRAKDDCWMVIGCGVYELGSYIHSGGDIIYSWCGTDATEGFQAEHPWLYLDLMLRLGVNLRGTFSGTFASELLATTVDTLAEHNSENDCWTCVDGTVYDISFYAEAHPGGHKVVEAMCGIDGTAFFRKAHKTETIETYRKVGTCSSGHTAEQEQILDILALVLLLLPPLGASALVIHYSPPRLQDKLLRHPVHAPLHSKFWGGLLNSYLEMPLGILVILLYFLVTVGVILALWLHHYSMYYPSRVVLPGALGRVTVYLVSLATYFGTKRLSIGWQLWAVSFERTLKMHYVVGTLASVFMLAHCGSYLAAWGPGDLPGRAKLTGYALLYSILVLFPAAVVTNVRIRFYAIFKITHFFAPIIMVVGIAHVCLLNVDTNVSMGLIGSAIWLAVATCIFFSDLVWTWRDASRQSAELVQGPWLLQDTSGVDYICVRLRKHVQLFPGCWLKVVCPKVNSALSHPFTAIVVDQPESSKGPATFDFIWKVNKPKSWTANLRTAIQDLQAERRQVAPAPAAPEAAPEAQAAERAPLKGISFLVAGPYGGGLGLLATMNTVIFVTAGVGITTAASIAPALLKQGKRVHVVWSTRSEALVRHCCEAYFPQAAGNGQGSGLHLQVHFTGAAEASLGWLPVPVARGRPNVALAIRGTVATAIQSGKETEVAVFACGPEELVRSTFAGARGINEEMGGKVHVHVHSESFQF